MIILHRFENTKKNRRKGDAGGRSFSGQEEKKGHFPLMLRIHPPVKKRNLHCTKRARGKSNFSTCPSPTLSIYTPILHLADSVILSITLFLSALNGEDYGVFGCGHGDSLQPNPRQIGCIRSSLQSR